MREESIGEVVLPSIKFEYAHVLTMTGPSVNVYPCSVPALSVRVPLPRRPSFFSDVFRDNLHPVRMIAGLLQHAQPDRVEFRLAASGEPKCESSVRCDPYRDTPITFLEFLVSRQVERFLATKLQTHGRLDVSKNTIIKLVILAVVKHVTHGRRLHRNDNHASVPVSGACSRRTVRR